MDNNSQQLDAMIQSLQGGVCLIEASAGTGKTYAITAIYLRLLLGISKNSAFSYPLRAEEILVVTFTEAATKELRNRIALSVYRLRLACASGKSEDSLTSSMLSEIKETNLAVHLLLAAENTINNVAASIFTIHSFCQRILNANSVELGILLHHSIIKDESILRQQAIADFWRKYCSPLPIAVASIIYNYWDGPESLLADLLPYLHSAPSIVQGTISNKNESIISCHESIITIIETIKKQWHPSITQLIALINANHLNRQVYSNKNISVWVNKIEQWVSTPTVDYEFPKEMERFRIKVISRYTTTKITAPDNPLFDLLELFYKKKTSLHELVFMLALNEVRSSINQEKKRLNVLGFDDLLNQLNRALALDKGEVLAQSLRDRYPVAMIDEFQDTNQQQHQIFSRIYYGQQQCLLIMIGDPKQAIYSFRGADIRTYISAREEIRNRYTLDTNWRSAPGMVNAVNKIFQSCNKPFVFNKIPFIPVSSTSYNKDMLLILDQKPQPAMRIWVQPNEGMLIKDYQYLMARKCSATVSSWLNAARDKRAWLAGRPNGRKILKASDMTVLVRNRTEAALIRDALSELSISSVYLSDYENIYESPEASELLWLLHAILEPNHLSNIRRAIATSIIGFDSLAIERLNSDKQSYNIIVQEFTQYQVSWKKRGVLSMLYEIIRRYHIAENLVVSFNGERRLVNLLHLGELLQVASLELNNEHALVSWFTMQISDHKSESKNHRLRLHNDSHLVHIMSVHKSKGLEFPLVFLPFTSNFKQHKKKFSLFTDIKNNRSFLDFEAIPKNINTSTKEEQLAEELRLLYVALTRAIYHCSIGVAPLLRDTYKQASNKNGYFSAFDYLMQQKLTEDVKALNTQMAALATACNGDIEICDIQISDLSAVKPLTPRLFKSTKKLAARVWNIKNNNQLFINSYSKLQENDDLVFTNLPFRIDMDSIGDIQQETDKQPLTPHTFTRGALSSTFLHNLFKKINFSQPLDSEWLKIKMIQNNIDIKWLSILQNWIKKVVDNKLNTEELCLKQITTINKIVDLKFYLYINNYGTIQDLDYICKRYDKLSAICPPLYSSSINGIIQGFIDLIFYWHGRYYLIDYKFNWLGTNNASYSKTELIKAMVLHRYDLQYQLYTLALHRYLRHRLVDYDYESHFGGIYYLFLRGIEGGYSYNGIYACRPNVALINGIDQLFSAK